MLNSRSQWVVGSALFLFIDCWSSIHRLHMSTSGIESVAVGFRVWTKWLLPATVVPQTCCSIHWNWYCLVTMVLPSLQTVKLEMVLWELHWNSTSYHRNKGGCVYSIPCCITHYGKVPNSHRDGGKTRSSWRDKAPRNESLVGKLRGTSKVIDSDARTRLRLRIGKGHQGQQ